MKIVGREARSDRPIYLISEDDKPSLLTSRAFVFEEDRQIRHPSRPLRSHMNFGDWQSVDLGREESKVILAKARGA